MQKKVLGRGLGALLGPQTQNVLEKSGIIEIDINKIEPNTNQPRKIFDEESLSDLAQSIKNYGIIQPIIVKDEGNYFSLIAGERRWRAAKIAKLQKIPVIIKDYNDAQIIQIAIIENIQRQDLNPIEEALCYKKLIDEFFFSQEEISLKIGKNRSTISQYLNLLNLDSRVQNLVCELKLPLSHAKILLEVKNNDLQFEIAKKSSENNYSTKEINEIIKNNQEHKKQKSNQNNLNKVLFYDLEQELNHIFSTKVSIKNNKNKGKIEIEYYSQEQLDQIICMIKKDINNI